MARRHTMSWYPMPSTCDDGTMADIEPVQPEKRNYRSATGNIAKDGYAVNGRRPRDSMPGSIMSNEDADRYEAFHETFED